MDRNESSILIFHHAILPLASRAGIANPLMRSRSTTDLAREKPNRTSSAPPFVDSYPRASATSGEIALSRRISACFAEILAPYCPELLPVPPEVDGCGIGGTG